MPKQDKILTQISEPQHTNPVDDSAANIYSAENIYHRMIAEIEDYAIILLDTQGNILNWNKGAQNIKGYHADEIIGQNFSIFYKQSDIAENLPQTLITQAIAYGKARHEGWRVRKDNTTFWGYIVITALHDNNNEIIGFSKVTRDLTERKLAEERKERQTLEIQRQNLLLQRSEERYHRMIAEVADYAIILLDTDGKILNWNQGAENIKGYTEQEILGKNFKSFYLLSDQKDQLPERLLAEAVANKKATHEGWRVRKDGSQFWGNVVITALHDNDGNVTGFSKVTRDLTQKKYSEDFILMQNKQLAEYAYVASHDLQEPLRKIMMFGSILKEKIDDKEAAQELLEKISSSTNRMSNLITAVLQYSQTSDTAALTTTVDLTEMMKEIESDFEMRLDEKNGKIIYSQLPSVKAIPIQMHQLFSNLIGNAIKFNESKPEITVTATPVDERFVRVRISDNGIGFSQEYSDKIFKMFQRLHDKTSGTGIGLALCKRIVENHGGTISASSVPGKGTTFEFLLPIN